MGTDIHMITQKYNPEFNIWETIEIDSFKDRDYNFFAILGNVRNGHGVAGHPKEFVFKPISSMRDLPIDIEMDEFGSVDVPGYYNNWNELTTTFWLGDHSHTWITGKELVKYPWTNIAIPNSRFFDKTIKPVSNYETLALWTQQWLNKEVQRTDITQIRYIFGFDS